MFKRSFGCYHFATTQAPDTPDQRDELHDCVHSPEREKNSPEREKNSPERERNSPVRGQPSSTVTTTASSPSSPSSPSFAIVITGKEHLLEHLLPVFIDRGFYGATLAELARATGLSKASLYHHFPGGKEEMVASLIHSTIIDFERHAWRHLQSSKPAQTRLLNFIDGFGEYSKSGEQQCLLTVLAQQPLPSPAGVDLGHLIHTQFIEWQSHLVSTHVDLGAKSKKATRQANLLLAELYGALIVAKLHNEPRFFTRQVKRTKRSIESP